MFLVDMILGRVFLDLFAGTFFHGMYAADTAYRLLEELLLNRFLVRALSFLFSFPGLIE